MAEDLLSGYIGNILNFVAAAGGLGTAAYGLVDSSKAIAGGISNAGFGYIRKALVPLVGPPGHVPVLGTLRANWLNGVAKADQKAIAKSLVRLGLTPENAPRLAGETGVDAARLATAARNVHGGEPLTQQDLNILGEFDAIVSAVLDFAYERADQLYRNAAKLTAALIAIALAAVAGGVIYYQGAATGGTTPSLSAYVGSSRFLIALLVGAISVPLAPIAKDVASSVQAAVKVVGMTRR